MRTAKRFGRTPDDRSAAESRDPFHSRSSPVWPPVFAGFSAACGSGTTGGVFVAVDPGPQNGTGGPVEGEAVDGGLPKVIGCDAGASASGGGFLDVTLSGGFSASDCCYGSNDGAFRQGSRGGRNK